MNGLKNILAIGLLCMMSFAVVPGCKSSDEARVKEHTIQECDLPDCPIHGKRVIVEKPAPKPAPAPAPAGSALYYPTAVRTAGGECCGQIRLERVAPAEVAVGQEYEYKIIATNMSGSQVGVRDVVVTDELPEGFEMTGSTPDASGKEGNRVSWNLGTLNPGESKTIVVKGKANAPGQVTMCASLVFTPFICATTNVIQPALQLTKTMTAEALICDPIQMRLVVKNTGSGTARDVRLTDALPEGLVTTDGRTSFDVAIGDLASGQSKEITVDLKATKTGKFDNTAKVAGAGGLTAEASASTVVSQPVLEIAKSGPEKAFIGKNVTYEIVVKNTGNAASANTVVRDAIGAGATFVSASDAGAFAAGNVTWNVGTIPAGGTKTVTVTVKPDGKGNICNTASVEGRCTNKPTAQACTEVVGIPAILLEVVDIEDPIQVGQNVTYEITVTNQGSADGHNIAIVVDLEDEMGYVSNAGPTQGTHADGKITFAPLPVLAPQAKATWRLTVKANEAGDVRLSVEMNEDRLTRPVKETEATNFYK